MEWTTIARPGFAGGKRDQLREMYDNTYGRENWRIAWQWGDEIILKEEACKIYEEGYYQDSFKREDIWKELIENARNVYDIEPRDVESGLDYLVQKGNATHLQDIAVRNVVKRRDWKFQGRELIQVRSHKSYWGKLYSPGKVMFHKPEMIIFPHLNGWWNTNSIEDWYQSNKVLQVLDLSQ